MKKKLMLTILLLCLSLLYPRDILEFHSAGVDQVGDCWIRCLSSKTNDCDNISDSWFNMPWCK